MTLDYVLMLFHLPILGQFYDLVELEFEDAWSAIVELLGINRGRATTKMEETCSPNVRLNWLRDMYVECREEQQ